MVSNTTRRRRQQRRAKTGRDLIDLIKLVGAVAAVTLIVLLVIRLTSKAPSQNTFLEGVYINGISLGGMTQEQGTAVVMDGLDKRINQDSYTLSYGDKQWTFTPSQFGAYYTTDIAEQLSAAWNFGHIGSAADQREQAAYVKEHPFIRNSEIAYDEAQLDAFLQEIKSQIDIAPVDATVVMGANQKLTVTQSSDGLTLPLDDLRETIDRAIREGTSTNIVLTPEVAHPLYSTDDLFANTQLIAEHTTSLKNSRTNRTKNVARALSFFDGVQVNPGETVSFNAVVGVRSKANGFFKATEYDGTKLKDGIGGGTCQASTTLYLALLKANIDIAVRSSHTMTVPYTSPSLDAAVSEQKDLRFTNNLAYPIYIYTQTTSEKARVFIYGPPCEYDIQLDYEIVETKSPAKRQSVRDESGKYAYYTDEYVLKEEGKDMVKSRGMRLYYDKATGALVEKQVFDLDVYYEKQPIYWRGIHEREF